MFISPMETEEKIFPWACGDQLRLLTEGAVKSGFEELVVHKVR